MIKYFSLFILTAFLVSCETSEKIIGTWEEINFKREILQFEEGGVMKIKQKGEEGETPINFKYEILESNDDYALLDVSVYNGKNFVKKAKHKVTFKGKNTITFENLDFPEVKSNTYSRK